MTLTTTLIIIGAIFMLVLIGYDIGREIERREHEREA